MTVNVGTNSITGIAAGGYEDQVFINRNFENGTLVSDDFASSTAGCVVKASFFEDATFNISDGSSTGSEVTFLSFSFTRTSNANPVLIYGWLPCAEGGSNLIGEFIRCNGVTQYQQLMYECPEGADSRLGIMLVNAFFTAAELGSGTSHTVSFGRQSRDGSGQSGPNYWNPQNTSSRHRENTTNLLILEVNRSTVLT